MILTLEDDINEETINKLLSKINDMGIKVRLHEADYNICLETIDRTDPLGVNPVISTKKTHQLIVKSNLANKKQITIGDQVIGGKNLAIIAGPCSIESEDQINRIACCTAKAGIKFLRGGAFKPRTSPYDFQGLGMQGINMIHAAARANNLYCVSEIMNEKQLEQAHNLLDVIQVGSRNMYNYELLKLLGKIDKPVLLKRGFSATYKEFLLAAEYLLNGGNENVILCERGIRTFEPYTRNTLDLNAVPVLKSLSHLPIIVDPSHGTGKRELVAPMARASVAAGADGVIIETHYDPDNAKSDAAQTIHTINLHEFVFDLERIYDMLNNNVE